MTDNSERRRFDFKNMSTSVKSVGEIKVNGVKNKRIIMKIKHGGGSDAAGNTAEGADHEPKHSLETLKGRNVSQLVVTKLLL